MPGASQSPRGTPAGACRAEKAWMKVKARADRQESQMTYLGYLTQALFSKYCISVCECMAVFNRTCDEKHINSSYGVKCTELSQKSWTGPWPGWYLHGKAGVRASCCFLLEPALLSKAASVLLEVSIYGYLNLFQSC